MLTVWGRGHDGHTHRPLIGRLLHTIFHLVQAAVSVVRKLEIVRYSGAAYCVTYMEVSVGVCSSVRYWAEVRYLECQLYYRESTVDNVDHLMQQRSNFKAAFAYVDTGEHVKKIKHAV